MPRTITDIIPPSRRRTMGDVEPMSDMPPEPPRPALRPMPRRRFPWGTAFIALIVVALCVGALIAFSGAKVEVVPNESTGSVSGSFTAMPNSGNLPFALVNVQKTATESVPAESTVTANDTAQGTITIYNTQSKPQQLINNTRFETSAGLIFKIHQSVTIPAGSTAAPGTLTATVYADSPGDTYNVGPSSFTVPGLSGTPQFSEVYAKSTSAMTGGFSGTRPAVSQSTDDSEHAKLQSALASQMSAEIAPKVPQGYVLIPGGVFTTYTTLPDAADSQGGVAVKEQATAVAVVFPGDALAKALASQVIGASYGGEPVTVKNVQSLALTAASSTTPTGNQPFTFTLSGNATLVWSVDASKVAGAVAGKSRASAQSVLTGFPEVGRAILTLRPFWTSTFPSDPADIKVTVDAP